MAINFLAYGMQALLVAKRAVLGRTEKVKIDGKDYEALIEEIPFDPENTVGGVSESGQLVVTVPISAMPNKPNQLAWVETENQRLQILSCMKTNGTSWTITAGDPSKE